MNLVQVAVPASTAVLPRKDDHTTIVRKSQRRKPRRESTTNSGRFSALPRGAHRKDLSTSCTRQVGLEVGSREKEDSLLGQQSSAAGSTYHGQIARRRVSDQQSTPKLPYLRDAWRIFHVSRSSRTGHVRRPKKTARAFKLKYPNRGRTWAAFVSLNRFMAPVDDYVTTNITLTKSQSHKHTTSRTAQNERGSCF